MNDSYECKFGTNTKVPATWISETRLSCITPIGTTNSLVNFDVLRNGAAVYNLNGLKFRFIGK